MLLPLDFPLIIYSAAGKGLYFSNIQSDLVSHGVLHHPGDKGSGRLYL